MVQLFRLTVVSILACTLVACHTGSKSTPTASVAGAYVGTSQDSVAGAGLVLLSVTQSGPNLNGNWAVGFSNPVNSNAGTATGTVVGNAVSATLTPAIPGSCPVTLTGTANGSVVSGTYVTANCPSASSGSFSVTLTTSLPSVAGTYGNGTIVSKNGGNGTLTATVTQSAGFVLGGNWVATFGPSSNTGSIVGGLVNSTTAVFYLIPSGTSCVLSAVATIGPPITGSYATVAGCPSPDTGTFTIK